MLDGSWLNKQFWATTQWIRPQMVDLPNWQFLHGKQIVSCNSCGGTTVYGLIHISLDILSRTLRRRDRFPLALAHIYPMGGRAQVQVWLETPVSLLDFSYVTTLADSLDHLHKVQLAVHHSWYVYIQQIHDHRTNMTNTEYRHIHIPDISIHIIYILYIYISIHIY